MAEYTIPDEPEELEKDEYQEQNRGDPPKASSDVWELHVDGSSNSTGSRAGLILSGPDGTIAEYVLRFEFSIRIMR